MTAPKEFVLARLVGKAHETRATERACQYARKTGKTVYAFRTVTGWGFDIAAPMGACIMAQPSGVVQHVAGPVI